MALKWYYSVPTASSYSSSSVTISSKGNNAIISRPLEYNGVKYGAQDNKAYSLYYYVYGTVSGKDTRNVTYKLTSNYTATDITGWGCRCYLLGAEENDITITGATTKVSIYDNAKIKGRWRIKDVIVKNDGNANKGNYFIQIPHTLTLKDGTVIANDLIGADTDDLGTVLYITFGSRSIGTTNYVSQYTVPNTYKDMIVDFGGTEQNIPSFLYDFIITNFTYIYPNTYTIKSPAGETLAQIDEQPPIKHTNLIQAGNSYQLSLTGTNDVVHTLTWEYDTPTNVVFEGLGTSPNGSVIIPVGEADITIEASTILYPIFRPYRPLPDVFGVNLYKNTAEANRVDKTNYITLVRTIRGVMRESSSVTNLSITIQYPNYPDFNYVRIPELKRFYFVNDIRLINANLYELDLEVDVLMTYKTALAECVAFIDRNELTSNPYIIDKKRVVEQGVNLETTVVSNYVFFENFDPDTEVLYVLNGYKLGTKPGGISVPE